MEVTKGNAEDMSWFSDNVFVADVSQTGVVTARHVGETKVRIGNAECKIVVSPMYSYYDEPLNDWGCSIDDIRNVYGAPRWSNAYENNEVINEYIINNGYAPRMAFDFINNKLRRTVVLFVKNRESQLYKFLEERYQLHYEFEDSEVTVIYYDSYDIKDSKTSVYVGNYDNEFVIVEYYDEQYWAKLYNKSANNNNPEE